MPRRRQPSRQTTAPPTALCPRNYATAEMTEVQPSRRRPRKSATRGACLILECAFLYTNDEIGEQTRKPQPISLLALNGPPEWPLIRRQLRRVVALQKVDALAPQRLAHGFKMHQMGATADLDITLDRCMG